MEEWLNMFTVEMTTENRKSDVQGRCHVTTASSSYTKAQDAYDDPNCVGGIGSPCSSA
jgi:hypothetical protein